MTPGGRFRLALEEERPLQIVGVINAYCGLLAERSGFRALYLSGAGVANASLGVPDLGISTLCDVCEDVRRICGATNLPLLVDADTGWGTAFNIARAVRELERAGAAGCHLEDQVQAKRCGHRPNKALVPADEMVDRVKAAVDARGESDFVIMARTDAVETEGLRAAIERCRSYAEAGADMIFAEAVTQLADYSSFVRHLNVPVLANLTEFGKTPLFTLEQLRETGVSMVLYPLSAFRAMSAAAIQVYDAIRREGSQQSVLSLMQTRDQLYKVLDYHSFEAKLDVLYAPTPKP
jgi:methylisocitrate lyase